MSQLPHRARFQIIMRRLGCSSSSDNTTTVIISSSSSSNCNNNSWASIAGTATIFCCSFIQEWRTYTNWCAKIFAPMPNYICIPYAVELKQKQSKHGPVTSEKYPPNRVKFLWLIQATKTAAAAAVVVVIVVDELQTALFYSLWTLCNGAM